jgi:hypothetical protein
MNYDSALVEVGRKAAEAHARSLQADAERDLLIRQANYHGGLSSRAISGLVGISHQRVAQVIKANPIGPKPVTLHDAMAVVLKGYGLDWVPVHEVARLITERGLYNRKDRRPLPPGQVRARASKYPELFEGTADGTNRIRLRRLRA